MSKRRQMTAADYAAMAICPSLIVLMLAALMHFVILCLYRGDYSARLTYILFMFIMGATGIARISIEYGRGHASIYAGALGLAVVFVLGSFTNFFLAVFVVGLVWFLADRITFDCTVIDDGQDASGEGLIESGGLFGGQRPQEPTDVSLDGTTDQPSRQENAEDVPKTSGKKKRKTYKPGKTVFYLALAALPLFGLGQLFLPPIESVRSQAAMALGLYLFATLTLLVVTSFLGLRRYLRQRGAEMPSNVAVAWVAGGAVLTAVMLLAAFALPMPGHLLAVAELPKIETPDWFSPSRFGWGSEGMEDGAEQNPDAARVTDPSSENPRGSETDQQGQATGTAEDSSGESDSGEASAGDQTGDEGSASGEQGDSDRPGDQGRSSSQGEQAGSDRQADEVDSDSQGKEATGDSQPSDPESSASQPSQDGSDDAGNGDATADSESTSQNGESETPAGESSSDETAGSSQEDSGATNESPSEAPPPSSSTPSLPNIFPALGMLFKVLIVLGLLAIIAIFLLKNPHIWRQWLDALADFFKRGERPGETSGGSETEPLAQVAYRPFGSFKNPLREGGDPRRAIVITFQALEAWAREQGDPRHDEETPAEFATRFAKRHPSFAGSLPQLADAYNRIVYGRSKAEKKDIDAAASIWKQMTSAPREASPAVSS